MAKITVHAGDFKPGGSHSLFMGALNMLPANAGLFDQPQRIPLSKVAHVETASEESVRKLGGTVGWGAAGFVVLGPVGLLAGLLMGGKRTEVTFVAKLTDGRKMLATTDAATFKKLAGAAF